MQTCDHCGTTCTRRYAVKRNGAVAMVGAHCAKRFPQARPSDLIRSLASDANSTRHKATKQPDWKLLWSTDYSALFTDQTGEYEPELMIAQEYEDRRGKTEFQVYRFSVDKQKIVKDPYGKTFVVPDAWDRTWNDPIHHYEEWFIKDLGDVARSIGDTKASLIDALTSDDPSARAGAYEAIGGYHGYDNLDSGYETWSEKKMEKEWP
jgi:hypothetical protein